MKAIWKHPKHERNFIQQVGIRRKIVLISEKGHSSESASAMFSFDSISEMKEKGWEIVSEEKDEVEEKDGYANPRSTKR